MIIIDPIYKLMGGRNENAAGEMAEFLNLFEKLSNETGAAVVYSHHFAKGLAAGKDQLDRASGSGVFSRHPDGIITMTALETRQCLCCRRQRYGTSVHLSHLSCVGTIL